MEFRGQCWRTDRECDAGREGGPEWYQWELCRNGTDGNTAAEDCPECWAATGPAPIPVNHKCPFNHPNRYQHCQPTHPYQTPTEHPPSRSPSPPSQHPDNHQHRRPQNPPSHPTTTPHPGVHPFKQQNPPNRPHPQEDRSFSSSRPYCSP